MQKSRLLLFAGTVTCLVLSVPAAAVPPATTSGIEAESPGQESVKSTNRDDVSRKAKPKKSSKIPEPSNLMMLGLGIAGLIAGRWAARRRRKNSSS